MITWKRAEFCVRRPALVPKRVHQRAATKTFVNFFIGLFALVASMGLGDGAYAECAQFPRVALWSELDHDFVRQHVDERYGGDWDAYIAKVERYQAQLRDIHDRGLRAGVTWRDTKVRLKGRQLADFLALVERRLEVTRCLADADSVADFSTAAGGSANDVIVDVTIQEVPRHSALAPKCAPLPRVEWWSFRTHEQIVRYVNRKHRGNWASYIDKWNKRLESLQDIYDRGSSAVTGTGKVLQGPELRAYLVQMDERIAVTRCLEKAHGFSNI